MDSINNAAALLEECLTNGDNGKDALYAWFLVERELIRQTITETSLIVAQTTDNSNQDQGE